MLSDNGEIYTQCPCCKACEECSDTKKSVNLQRTCLVIYQQKPQAQLNKNVEPVRDMTSDDIFVFHNTNDEKFTMSYHISAEEIKSINCPRCKYIIERAKQRMQAKGQYNKNAIIGVCDHCRNKSLQQISCRECEDIANKFITSIRETSRDSGLKPKTWLTNAKHLLHTKRVHDEKAERNIQPSQRVAQPYLFLNKLQETIKKADMSDPSKDREFKMKPKTFKAYDEENISKPKSDVKKIYKTRSVDSYLHKLENIADLKERTWKHGREYVSKTDGMISSREREHYSYDKTTREPDEEALFGIQDTHSLSPNIHAAKRHITSPGERYYDSLHPSARKLATKPDRKEMKIKPEYYQADDENLGSEPVSRSRTDVTEFDTYNRQNKNRLKAPFYGYDFNEQLQRPDLIKKIQDIKKPEEIIVQKDIKRKATKSVKVTLGDTSILTTSRHRAMSETSIHDLGKISLPKGVFKSVSELFTGLKPKKDLLKSDDYIEHLVSSTVPRIKTSKKTDDDVMYHSPNKKYPSEETLSVPILPQSEIHLRKDFSYQFPKEIFSKKEPKHIKTSAELIKETQDMLSLREEEKQQRMEIERARKRLEEELKKKAREEKKRIQEEKRQEEEVRRKIKEEENKRAEEERRKLEAEKKKEDAKLRAKEGKKVKDEDGIKTKASVSEENQQKATEDKDTAKAGREAVKEERKKAEEEKRRAREEAGEKSKSDKVDKDKEKADKEAEKLRKQKEKEIQLKMQKEDKQREKEEKERLKKEKEEQLRAEKEKEKQTEKEEGKAKQKQKSAPVAKTDKEKAKSEPKQESQKLESSTKKPEEPKQETKLTVGDIKKIKDETKDNGNGLKRKKETLAEKHARDEADKKEKEIEKLGKVHGNVAKAVIRVKPAEEPTTDIETEESPGVKELDLKQIKVRKPSYDDLILKLVRLKQGEPTEKIRQKEIVPVLDIPLIAREHKTHKYTKVSKCLMCVDSEFELDVEDILMKPDRSKEATDIIIGQKVFKFKPHLLDTEEKAIVVPSIFQSTFQVEPDAFVAEEPEHKSPVTDITSKSQKLTDQEAPKGFVRYALSDRTFIEKGWTMLPTEKVVRKMNVYRMRPAHPEFDWFEHNKKKKLMLYDTGEKMADFEDNGRSRLYYKNGRLALDYYDAEEINAQQRFVVFSSGELDERGRSHPITVLATFDYLGNGIVFDHSGKIRLKYNQTEGVVLDRNIGPVSHWKWHTLNDPPVLQKVMIDTQMAHKDPDIVKMGSSSDDKSRPDNEEMLAIEFDNFIKEKSKKLTQTFKPFQIKMKALKINEHFSLKILDQATIYLIFRDNTTNVKINIGMILDHKEIVDTDTAEVGEVSNNLERFPARTDSLAGLQRSVAYAQRFERARLEREQRLRPPEPCASADQLTAASSHPLRHPLRTVASTSTTAASSCKCTRKPCSSNVYYDTRLI